ncbi:hypothetical protein GALL_07340 [mine drainage metagenome]|uniref:Uncharacterized protein n=1 Tax=mine drainage metagenome TaxID=410659 RepID=A0A1J5TFT9_9ZZZZ
MNINESEARLGKLTRKTFLSMWSYQNPYFETGKELCDVLVVFGNDIILMSDKLIQYGDHESTEVNWKRWYKKAVAGSVKQLRGALRQIKMAPQKIFCDALASSPFPLELPPINQMRIHLIAIANGCEKACEQSHEHASLKIDTSCIDDSKPLTVGTYVGTGNFIHVISTKALEAIFECFDTTRDFIDYLDRKQTALSQGNWLIHGEESLIGGYMLSQPGNRPFSIPVAAFPIENNIRVVHPEIWPAYLTSNERQQREQIRTTSYDIDRLIEHVADEYRQNNMVIGQDQALAYHERAFRLIAGESRFSRQFISAALREIWNESTRTFWSTIVASQDFPNLYYLWLLYPEPLEDWSVEQYEEILLNQLTCYMLVARSKFPEAQFIFGICLPNRDCSKTSRAFRVMDGKDWTIEQQELAEKLEQEYGILSNIETTLHVSQRC